MSIVHHPEAALLLSYASGAADEATSLVIATHLALCSDCRSAVLRAESAGGVMIDSVAPQAVDARGLEAVLSRLDGQEQPKAARPAGVTPEPLRSYLGGELTDVKWRRLTAGISDYRIMKRGKSVARLLKATAGTAISQHTHKGEEITLILTGGLGDHTGQYHRGDVQSMTPADLHEPTALPGEDCIVLAVTDAPLKFTSPVMALFAKVLRF